MTVSVSNRPSQTSGPAAPADLRGVPNPFASEALEGIPVPVVPEVC